MPSFFRSIATGLKSRADGGSGKPTRPRSDGFQTAIDTEALFPKTRPSVDGDECLHDCESCTIDYPRKWKIDEDRQLYGELERWSQQLLIATGKSDWVKKVGDEPDSVMEAFRKHEYLLKDEPGFMLNASNMALPDDNPEPYGANRPTSTLLMPAFQFIDGVTPRHVPELISTIINPSSTTTTFLQKVSRSLPTDLPGGMQLRHCHHKYIILLCSQGTRDARCGQSAPLLLRELERHLRPLGLYRDLNDIRPGGVGIYFVSHVGGHKFSANVMIYRRESLESEATQGIWLARVRPEDIENIVKYTLLQGKVVKPGTQLRGGFDRERGIVSW